jgi:CubicO group peptidase (beta-lactamase class C family)
MACAAVTRFLVTGIFAAIAACVVSGEDAPKGSPADGIWLGTLTAGPQSLRIQLHITSDSAGTEHCTLDSLDQGAAGLPCENVKLNGTNFSFDVPVVHGRWSGTLSADHNDLNGSWSQGTPLPLNFKRQASAVAMKITPPSFDSAMPPVSLSDLQSVLDRDLAEALKSGALAPATGGGVAIGVRKNGEQRVFTYGTAKADSIFEIGSVTKTFTGLILARMLEQHKVTLDEPVRDLLPPGTVPKPPGTEITLLDLVTQHSGLPRMPDNFHPADPENPYADYHAANLYEFLSKHGVGKAGNPPFLYSNLGVGLLGQALAERAHSTYPEVLKAEVTDPLQLHDTAITLSPDQQRRFLQGHDGKHNPAHAWDLDALAGAGAIRSTAGDMLTYLDANLHPEKVPPMAAALNLSHDLRANVAPGMRIAFAWLYNNGTGSYWHNGGTGGFSSYVLFNPKGDYAVVVLFNTTVGGPGGSFADRLGEHVSQRMTGKPAISLKP